MKICSVMPCNMLTLTFLEKHVSLNYNPCWYQNVCSLNIYQPRVTSKAEHRHLETSLFFLQVLCPKGNAVKALQTILQVSKLSEHTTHSSNTSNSSEEENISATNKLRCLKIRVSERDELGFIWFLQFLHKKGRQ